ncbi:AcrR family transcriptional regulator [Rhodococcus sp. 27YEA15]|uniref:TetR/AcrR family transcriptional regulator n=1 Tax=Rhodococcus sp. 27YEA15 TaxID=3156259 RepID=UPI003C7C6A2A
MAGVPGQGRKFDIDAALAAAMALFWQQGYEATSVSELTKAMGISPPSLYAAFGDKRQLFCRVLDFYLQGPGSWMEHALNEPVSADRLVANLLVEAARHYADPLEPGGCLVINAGSTVTDPAVAELLRNQRNTNIIRVEELLRLGAESGQLSADIDPRAAADFIGATVQGMSTRARDGADVAQLIAVAVLAARALGIEVDADITRETRSRRD